MRQSHSTKSATNKRATKSACERGRKTKYEYGEETNVNEARSTRSSKTASSKPQTRKTTRSTRSSGKSACGK